jgi:hypothetical protein
VGHDLPFVRRGGEALFATTYHVISTTSHSGG